MSLKNLTKILVKILIMGFIFLYLMHDPVAEEQLSLRWTFDADSKIKALTSGDLDNDNYTEIVAVSSKRVYVLDTKGNLKKEYPIKFNPSAIFIADIDNDSIKEILIGSGWMNTTDIKGGRFEFEDIENIKEKEEFLYRITRNQGDIYVIQEDKKEPVKWLEVGEWIRDIFVDDLDGDGNNEILIASGGSNIDYIELVTTAISNKTGNLTYVRDYKEESSENGSVWIFYTNGSLSFSYHTDNIVWCVYSSLIREGEGKAISAGSKKLIVMDENAVELWTFESLGEDYSIKEVLIDDIDNNRINEVVTAFTSPIVSGIHVLDRDGSEIWQYRISSKNILGLFSINLDIDDDKEIVIASDKSIYVLDKKGGVEWTYLLTRDIDGIQVTDLGDNEYKDFIIASGNSLFAYEISKDFIKLQRADRYYQEAKRYYDSANYQDAIVSLTNARYIYSELGNSEGISICDSLLEKINEGLKEDKRGNANSLYRKALSKYYLGEYKEAREYAENALEIYTQIEDEKGISKCNSLLKDIEEALGPEVTTTSITLEETTTTIITDEGEMSSIILILLLIIIIILIAFGLHQIAIKRSKRRKVEK